MKKSKSAALGVAWVALGAALVACGSSADGGPYKPTGNGGGGGGSSTAVGGAGGSGGASATTASMACVPGKQEPCACPGGANGAQACRADGAGYEACKCGAGGAGGAGGGTTSSMTTSSSATTTTATGASYCKSVTELSDPKGLTDAMRQEVGNVTGGMLPGTGISFLDYVSVFGLSPNTYPIGSGDTVGYGFPGTNTTTIATYITRDKFVSLQFRAPTDEVWNERSGYYSLAVNPQNMGFSAAIAPCPGQFDSDPLFPIDPACKGEALFTDITWRITAGSTNSCKLEPGKTYYFNLIHAPRDTPAQSDCAGASCRVELRNAHN